MSAVPLMARVGNFTVATVRHALDMFANVDDKTFGDRMAVCALCEHKAEKSWTCNHCGCNLEVKAKWRSETCPLGKWNKPAEPPAGSGGCGCGS